jgi:AcrR family transcriptional regulator
MDGMDETTNGAGKSAYHHGDLRNALIDAASALARDGGPDAVVLRAAARRVGVSPTAAYRHFQGQGELLLAVKARGQQLLAERMDSAIASVPEDQVRQRVVAMGRAYVAFALEEPGLFRSAFCHTRDHAIGLSPQGAPQPAGGEWEFRSFQMLVEILDGLLESGLMPPERRPGAEVTAWSMVHGLATLLLDGPFALLPPDQRDAAVDRALETLATGFTTP